MLNKELISSGYVQTGVFKGWNCSNMVTGEYFVWKTNKQNGKNFRKFAFTVTPESADHNISEENLIDACIQELASKVTKFMEEEALDDKASEYIGSEEDKEILINGLDAIDFGNFDLLPDALFEEENKEVLYEEVASELNNFADTTKLNANQCKFLEDITSAFGEEIETHKIELDAKKHLKEDLNTKFLGK